MILGTEAPCCGNEGAFMNRKPPVGSSSMLMVSLSLLSEEYGREPKTTEENTAAPYLRQSVWLCEVVCAAIITFS